MTNDDIEAVRALYKSLREHFNGQTATCGICNSEGSVNGDLELFAIHFVPPTLAKPVFKCKDTQVCAERQASN
jgi:hypothetical protein